MGSHRATHEAEAPASARVCRYGGPQDYGERGEEILWKNYRRVFINILQVSAVLVYLLGC